MLVEALNQIEGIEAHKPEAGFYVFPKITKLLKRTGFEDDETFRKVILKETGISFCGRQHFGRRLKHENDFYIRLAFSGISKEEIAEGMAIFKDWINNNTK